MNQKMYPPYSYETIKDYKTNEITFRIRDRDDNALGRSYVEENAILIVQALNKLAGKQ